MSVPRHDPDSPVDIPESRHLRPVKLPSTTKFSRSAALAVMVVVVLSAVYWIGWGGGRVGNQQGMHAGKEQVFPVSNDRRSERPKRPDLNGRLGSAEIRESADLARLHDRLEVISPEEAMAIVKRAGILLTGEYLRDRPPDPDSWTGDVFDESLAAAALSLEGDVSVRRALEFLERSKRTIAEFDDIYTSLASKCMLDRDKEAYASLVGARKKGLGENAASSETIPIPEVGKVIVSLGRTGMSLGEMRILFHEMGEDFDHQAEGWFLNEFDVRVFGGDEKLAADLGKLDAGLRRQFVIARAESKTTDPATYLAENLWLTDDERRYFLPHWLGRSPEAGMKWVLENDRAALPEAIRDRLLRNPKWVADWYQRQSDAEARRIYESEAAKWR